MAYFGIQEVYDCSGNQIHIPEVPDKPSSYTLLILEQKLWREYLLGTSGAQAVQSSCTQRNSNAGLRNYNSVAAEHFSGNAQFM